MMVSQSDVIVHKQGLNLVAIVNTCLSTYLNLVAIVNTCQPATWKDKADRLFAINTCEMSVKLHLVHLVY